MKKRSFRTPPLIARQCAMLLERPLLRGDGVNSYSPSQRNHRAKVKSRELNKKCIHFVYIYIQNMYIFYIHLWPISSPETSGHLHSSRRRMANAQEFPRAPDFAVISSCSWMIVRGASAANSKLEVIGGSHWLSFIFVKLLFFLRNFLSKSTV